MTEIKHTPGPWFSKRAGTPQDGEYDYAIIAKIGGEPMVIAEAFGRVSETKKACAEANARLIARAPELLAENEKLRGMTKRADLEQLFIDLEEYFDGMADAEFFPDSASATPNAEMRLLVSIKEAQAVIKENG